MVLLIFLMIPYVSAENVTIDNTMSIQDTVNNVNDNDVIFLMPGTYVESGIEIDKNITLQGLGNTSDVIIDSNHTNSIILVNSVSKVKFFNLTFINGKGPDYGGAIHSELGGQIYVDHCDFINNTAGHNGGAIDIAGEQHRIKWETFTNYGFLNATNCNFINNSAGHDGGALATYWGNSYIYNSTFRLNYAERDGGALRVGVYSTTLTENCTFDNNNAKEWGGALYNWPGQLTVNNCTISNNYAGIQGGAMITSGGLNVTNSKILNNTAKRKGGAIFIAEETPHIPSTVIFSNNIISGNTAKVGSLVYVDETTATGTSFDGNIWDIDPNSDEWEKAFITNDLIKSPTIFVDENGNTYVVTPKEKPSNPDDTPHVPDEKPNHHPETPEITNQTETPENTNQSDDVVENNTNKELQTNSSDNTNKDSNQTQNSTDIINENTNTTQTDTEKIESDSTQTIPEEIQEMIEEVLESVNTQSNSTTTLDTSAGISNMQSAQNQNQEPNTADESPSTVGKENTAHEITKKDDVSKKAEQSPLPYIIAIVAVMAILIFGYTRRKDE
ncbi:polymorphic outer membrane protein repeat-containing protein [Methanobrevibacter millerae]|uniref:Polymorphic outer membrane protein repeat-containing protein n=2 Tax=Methanobrevibacter millerae TaxID=230361 RepID=A0A1G5VVZ1_9EURY|nr:polymorphic outer membrane protein repeat-containing protein [Methanobrevibacter millerae]